MSQAQLWVEILPTTKGIQKQVENDLGGAFATTESRAKTFWGKVAGFAGVATTAIAGTAAVIAGISLKGGLERALNIEDATAKLKGLGNSTETVSAIMQNALASVKGTAFGLDTAAAVAASAVAAGIKPGQQLEKYLRLTADAATIAGGSLEDLGNVMNNVTTVGAAYNDSLQILAQKGIPIYQYLADELGITTDAVKNLASEGGISAEQFRAAIEKNIGGAALSAGDTTRGAYANMLASLSRIGANLLSGVFPLFKETFQGITSAMAPVETAAKNVGTAFGEFIIPIAEKVSTAFKSIDLSAIRDGLSGLAPIIGPLVGGLIALSSSFLGTLPVIGKLIPVISGPLGIVLGLVAALIATSPELRAVLGDAFSQIAAAIGSALATLAPLFAQLVPVIGLIAGALAGALSGALTALLPFIISFIGLLVSLVQQLLPVILPLIQDLAGTFAVLLGALMPLVGSVLDALLPALMLLVPVIVGIVQAIAPLVSQIITALLPVFTALIPPIMGIVSAILPLVAVLISALMPIFNALLPVITMIINTALMPLLDIFSSLLTPILGLIGPLLGLLTDILTPLIPIITMLITNALQPLMMAFQMILPPVMQVVSGLAGSLIPIITAVMDILGGLITFLTGVFTGNWKMAWDGIKSVFKGIWDAIIAILRGAVNLAIDMINGIISGINDVAGAVKDATGGAINIHIGKIPRLANGALVSSGSGGALAQIGEGRYDEAVMPLGGPQLEKIRAALQGGNAPQSAGAVRDVIFQNPDPYVLLDMFNQKFGSGLRVAR